VANPAVFFLRRDGVSDFFFWADSVLLDRDPSGAFAWASADSSMPNSETKSDHPAELSCGVAASAFPSAAPLSDGPESLAGGAGGWLEDGCEAVADASSGSTWLGWSSLELPNPGRI
jgi:hypothetical protein